VPVQATLDIDRWSVALEYGRIGDVTGGSDNTRRLHARLKADGSQTTDPQRDALVEAGVDDERLYEDKASGRRDDRPGLVSCLKSLRDGDTLVVWKLDRLGRDLHHLVTTVHDLTDRGVGLRCSPVRCGDRHHHRGGQARLRDLRCPGRVERELISERTIAASPWRALEDGPAVGRSR